MEIETVIKNPPANKSPVAEGFIGEFYQKFQGRANTYPIQTLLPNSFYEATITLIPK